MSSNPISIAIHPSEFKSARGWIRVRCGIRGAAVNPAQDFNASLLASECLHGLRIPCGGDA